MDYVLDTGNNHQATKGKHHPKPLSNSIALTIHFALSSNWTLHRIALAAKFEGAQLEARTDGYLSDDHGKPRVLIEVKPVTRSKKMVPIRMQESAQMVAWIKNDNDLAQGRDRIRLHVSQDRHEIFVTVAQYDEDYLAYLNNTKPRSESLSFLTMHEFGP